MKNQLQPEVLRLVFHAVSLYLDNQKLSLKVSSTPKQTASSAIVFRGQNGGEVQNIHLPRGYYKIIMSGGGGSGGASDTSSGSNYDAPATNGERRICRKIFCNH